MSAFSRRLGFCVAACLLAAPFSLYAEDKTQPATKPATKEEYLAYVEGKKAQLHPKSGKIELPGGKVTLNLPADYGYLNPAEAEIVLHDIWNNPPDDKTLGVIMPLPLDLSSNASWAITLEYSADGHVNDDDAKKINYDEMLQQLKEGTESGNERRRAEGYAEAHLVGWAEKPYYDETTHKLYWAKDFIVGNASEHSLNYDIRVLGREGVFIMSILGGIDQLPMIHANRDKILSFVEFNDTQRYTDFNASTDKVAAYGMAALIAGGIAAKAGLFKGLIVALIAAKKLVLVAVIGAYAFIKNLFSRNKKPKA